MKKKKYKGGIWPPSIRTLNLNLERRHFLSQCESMRTGEQHRFFRQAHFYKLAGGLCSCFKAGGARDQVCVCL